MQIFNEHKQKYAKKIKFKKHPWLNKFLDEINKKNLNASGKYFFVFMFLPFN